MLIDVPPTSLDKYAFKLSAWLKTEATKSRKQRRALKQMHIDLCALGFEGSYDRVAAFARQWKVDQLERVNSASKSTVRCYEAQILSIESERRWPKTLELTMSLDIIIVRL